MRRDQCKELQRTKDLYLLKYCGALCDGPDCFLTMYNNIVPMKQGGQVLASVLHLTLDSFAASAASKPQPQTLR